MMQHFFTYPTTRFHVRELSRVLRVSTTVILSTLKKLQRDGIIVVERGPVLTTMKANTDNVQFTRLKRVNNLESFCESGLVDYLISEFHRPRAIVCFGSYSRGDDTESSDIDIAIIDGKEIEVNLNEFEKKLKRLISIHVVDLKRISNEFRANLSNGIVLDGAL